MALVVTLAGVDLSRPGDRGDDPAVLHLDVAQAAARALTPGESILYYKMRIDQRGPGATRIASISESWVPPGGAPPRMRSTTLDGHVRFDQRLRYAGTGRDDVPNGPVEIIREMLRDGILRPTGLVAGPDGRRLQRLESTRARTPDLYLVDAVTYEPVRVVAHVRRPGLRLDVVTTFLAFERLPDDAEHRRLLDPPRKIPSGVPRPG